jgi:hypothetical protein
MSLVRSAREPVCQCIDLEHGTVSRKARPGQSEKSDESRRIRQANPAAQTPARTSAHCSPAGAPLSRSSPVHKVKKRRPSHLAAEKLSWPLDPLPAPAEYLTDQASFLFLASHVPNICRTKQLRFEATCTVYRHFSLCALSHFIVMQVTCFGPALRGNHAFSLVRKSCTAHKDSVRRRWHC